MKKTEKNKLQSFFKRGICGLLAFMMLITAFPLQALAADLNYDKTKITSQQNLNKEPVTVMQTKGKKAEEVVKNPDMPKLYTMRADYKLPRNDEEVIGYQPYIATVGDDEYTYTDLDGNEDQKVLTDEEKSKIDKIIDLPGIDGYTSPTKSFHVNYDYIKENAKKGNLDVNEYIGRHPYRYEAKRGTIKIKHTFQMLENRDEYGLRDGDNKFIYTTQHGLTGTSVTIKALDGEQIKGYVPEVNVLTTQVPQNSNDFEIEMRYNRAIYDVNFDSNGGTDLPGMTLIYGQTIPKLNFDIKKAGSELQGWKADKDITYTDADGNKKTLSKDTLITKKDFEAGGKFQDGIKYAMPAESLTFTAQWTENKTAEYVIQFWTEKPDYDDQNDKLPLRDRYDFIGARRVDNVETGSTPELTNLDIHGITFPDLNEGRLEKAQDDKKEFERYYFLNEELTKKQNASKEDPTVQKSVLSTGETVYNVYYDRRVYTLYFTAANEEGWVDSSSYWPTITRNGKVIGQEGSPYKVDARFNQSLDKIWPRDEEISGLPQASSAEGVDMGPIGWIINVNEVGEQIFRDTPPYRLSAEDFIDSEDVEEYGLGHGDQIPIGDNQTKARGEYEISLGSTAWDESVVHHIDIIKDDFHGKEQIDYALSYWKSDTNVNYAFILPNLQGFTLKEETREAEWILEKPTTSIYRTIDDLNRARNEKTPFRSDADKIEYIAKFPWGTKFFDGKNRYNFANYSRNKYKLKLNNDPKIVKNDNEYGADNILDVPYEKPLKNLKLDTDHVPKRPAWVPEDWSFLGWALDPAGENLVKDGNETKLHYDQVLYAKWGEPDTVWRVKFDPNGGELRDLSPENISSETKKLEIDGVSHTYPEKVDGENNVFNLIHNMTLNEPRDAKNNIIEPTRPGYNFAGWEFVRYTKDENGNDTKTEDASYKDLYKVPEMYHFGNKVVSNVHLRAIWNKQDLITVESIHHFLNLNYEEDSKEIQNLYNRRVGSYTTGLASRQGDKYLLVPQAEWEALYNANTDYKTYKDETARENSYNQILRVEPEKVHDPETGALVDNPKAENNRFEFFYKPFKERVYDVNYLDDRGKAEVEEFMTASKAKYQEIKNNTSKTPEEKSAAYKELLANNKKEFAKIKEKYAVVPSETVVNGKRHYDARNYRKIPGWVLNDKPQQQLFFDIYEDTDTFAGINESGLDEINFFYKDVRVIEVKNPDEKVPDGYKRVTFVAEDGGNFTDDKGNEAKELYYDVIVGLKSDNLPVPEEVKEDEEKVEGKYYITPDAGKKFIKWDKEKLLNSNTIIDRDYTFTAYFDWSGIKVHELVRTESYKDSDGNWNNDFAPSLEDLKKQVKWVNKDGSESNLPKDATVTIVDENGKELSQEDIYEKVKELGKLDSDELVRTVKFSGKVKFADNSVQDIEIPVKIYKNVYEGLTTGAMPKVLKDATSAPDGDLVKVTGDYVKVTVNPTGKPGEKDSKIYYVNPKAWVEIPEIKLKDEEKAKLGFTRWTSNNDEVNTNGEYIFEKENVKQRYKFTKDTLIQPDFSNDVVEQTDPNKKPDVPDNFVKVVVKTTDKATSETAFEKIFWVNPSKEVTILVDNPIGKTVDKTATEEAKAWTFTKWQSDEETPRTWTNGIKGQFTKDTTITAEYADVKNIIPYDPNEPITRPDGYVRVKFEADDGLTLSKVNYYYVKANAGITLGKLDKATVTEKTGYKFNNWDKDDTLEITNADIVVKALSRKIDPIIPENNDDGMPNDKPEGYKEVVFVAAENGKLEGLTKFYVNPDEYVTINPPTAVGNTGYEFGSWDKDATIPTVYKEDTTITASFNELKAVIPKTKDDDTEKPAGYKIVTFVIEGEGGNIVDGETTTYFVNPEKEVTINPPQTFAETAYTFNAWDKDTRLATKYAVDTKVKGTFTKLDDIIPSTDDEGNENPKPDGYVTVTFDKGEHGKDIKGQRVYYVNPKANISLGDTKIVKPTVSPETGWRTHGWDKDDTQSITDDLTVNAKYAPIDDVIPENNDDGTPNEKPDGYITVSFDKGKHGTLTGNTVFYINPNKSVVLEEKAPTVKANKGYTFARWDTSIEKAIQYKDGDKITALYNEPGDISEKEVEDYVKVEFNKGQHGSLEGKTEYWVKPGVEVNLPAPTVKPNVGYKFTNWDKDLTLTLKAGDPTYVITAEYEDLGNIIPQEKPDGSDKPEGYVTVTFKAVNGSLEGITTYYVKADTQVDLTDTANGITKKADVGYTAEGGTWDKTLEKTFTNDEGFTFNFKKLDDVIEDKGQEKPEGYVSVKFIPTSNAQDPTEKVYFVNPKANVTIAVAEPVGKEVTDASGNKYTFNFKLWTVTRGTVATWDKGTAVSGQFIQDTEITAKYSTKVDAGEIIPSPIGKKNVVTPINEMPKPEDLIENKTDLPEGTTYTYTEDGNPDVSKVGDTKGKVEVKYPNGKTVVVEVPIKVVDHVVPQTGDDKPLVPENYVKVTVDTTDKATANTKFTKVFWVKPNVEVTIPDILAPTGKEVVEDGVTKTNQFVKWVSDDGDKAYTDKITDTFTKNETKITATYEFDKNVEPVGKNDQWIPQGSNPSPKDFIKNLYDDNDPKNPDNLPPGTQFEFVPGTEPNTNEAAINKTTTIKVTYPNGEVVEVPVTYNVTGDVVEQPDPNDPNTKPDVPDNFVKVIVDKTDKAELKAGEQESQMFWVNPEKVVTLPVAKPTGKEVTKEDGTVDFTWLFTGWDKELTKQFTEETRITAQYKKDYGELPEVKPIPEAKGDFIYTDLGKEITDEQYKNAVKLPDGYSFDSGTSLEIVENTKPNVNVSGKYYVDAWVTYPNGESQLVTILVYVGEARPDPKPEEPDRPDYPEYPDRPYIPMYPEVRYETIIQEKIVKVPMPISDDNYFKEVRYMQGFKKEFRPHDGLTRAEAAQILANALVEDGYKYNPNYKLPYKDIGEAWYTRAVKIVTEANVFEGYDDGNFKPQGKITRNEWIATLKRFQELNDLDGNHMNLKDGHWASKEIEAAYNEGWLKIYTDGLAKYEGDKFIPREEVAAVSNKAFKRTLDKTYIRNNEKSLITYKDVKKDMWSYEDILCASNTFLNKKDLYRAHWINEDNNTFNIDTRDFEIVKAKFQRNPR